MNKVIRIGRVELTEDEAWSLYEQNLFVVTFSKIYELHYSQAQKRVYGSEIHYEPGMTRRGRFHTMSGEAVNRLVGFPLVNVSSAEKQVEPKTEPTEAEKREALFKELENAVALDYKGIVFDNWTVDFETGGIWGEMCEGCAENYKDVLSEELSDGGVGACSVFGCDVVGADSDNERHYYVDFKPELIKPLDERQLEELYPEKVSLQDRIYEAKLLVAEAFPDEEPDRSGWFDR